MAEPALRADPPADWVPAVAARRRARQGARVVTRVRPDRPRSPGDDRVAVVVITYNRRDELVANLRRLHDLPEHPHVVVVDNASSDGSAEAVRRIHPWVELVVLDRNAGAAGRNVAVDLVDAAYVAFADDDTWWQHGSLARAADILDAHRQVAAVTATILTEPAGTEDPVVEDMRDSSLPDEPGLPGHPLLSILAGASVLRRVALQQVGGFEPRFGIGGEEELLSADLAAAGWAMRHIPELTVHHAASPARDPHGRRADGLRNTLWFAWLRRPLPDAARRSVRTLRASRHDRVTLIALAGALAGAPWILQERRPLPGPVAAALRLLDEQQVHSKARRYVS